MKSTKMGKKKDTSSSNNKYLGMNFGDVFHSAADSVLSPDSTTIEMMIDSLYNYGEIHGQHFQMKFEGKPVYKEKNEYEDVEAYYTTTCKAKKSDNKYNAKSNSSNYFEEPVREKRKYNKRSTTPVAVTSDHNNNSFTGKSQTSSSSRGGRGRYSVGDDQLYSPANCGLAPMRKGGVAESTGNVEYLQQLRLMQKSQKGAASEKKEFIGVLVSGGSNAGTTVARNAVAVPKQRFQAVVTVSGRQVNLGTFPTATDAAMAHDRALIRATGPKNCSELDLNFAIPVQYAHESLERFSEFDSVLKRQLFGSSWPGPQPCDFGYLLATTTPSAAGKGGRGKRQQEAETFSTQRQQQMRDNQLQLFNGGSAVKSNSNSDAQRYNRRSTLPSAYGSGGPGGRRGVINSSYGSYAVDLERSSSEEEDEVVRPVKRRFFANNSNDNNGAATAKSAATSEADQSDEEPLLHPDIGDLLLLYAPGTGAVTAERGVLIARKAFGGWLQVAFAVNDVRFVRGKLVRRFPEGVQTEPAQTPTSTFSDGAGVEKKKGVVSKDKLLLTVSAEGVRPCDIALMDQLVAASLLPVRKHTRCTAEVTAGAAGLAAQQQSPLTSNELTVVPLATDTFCGEGAEVREVVAQSNVAVSVSEIDTTTGVAVSDIVDHIPATVVTVTATAADYLAASETDTIDCEDSNGADSVVVDSAVDSNCSKQHTGSDPPHSSSCSSLCGNLLTERSASSHSEVLDLLRSYATTQCSEDLDEGDEGDVHSEEVEEEEMSVGHTPNQTPDLITETDCSIADHIHEYSNGPTTVASPTVAEVSSDHNEHSDSTAIAMLVTTAMDTLAPTTAVEEAVLETADHAMDGEIVTLDHTAMSVVSADSAISAEGNVTVNTATTAAAKSNRKRGRVSGAASSAVTAANIVQNTSNESVAEDGVDTEVAAAVSSRAAEDLSATADASTNAADESSGECGESETCREESPLPSASLPHMAVPKTTRLSEVSALGSAVPLLSGGRRNRSIPVTNRSSGGSSQTNAKDDAAAGDGNVRRRSSGRLSGSSKDGSVVMEGLTSEAEVDALSSVVGKRTRSSLGGSSNNGNNNLSQSAAEDGCSDKIKLSRAGNGRAISSSSGGGGSSNGRRSAGSSKRQASGPQLSAREQRQAARELLARQERETAEEQEVLRLLQETGAEEQLGAVQSEAQSSEAVEGAESSTAPDAVDENVIEAVLSVKEEDVAISSMTVVESTTVRCSEDESPIFNLLNGVPEEKEQTHIDHVCSRASPATTTAMPSSTLWENNVSSSSALPAQPLRVSTDANAEADIAASEESPSTAEIIGHTSAPVVSIATTPDTSSHRITPHCADSGDLYWHCNHSKSDMSELQGEEGVGLSSDLAAVEMVVAADDGPVESEAIEKESVEEPVAVSESNFCAVAAEDERTTDEFLRGLHDDQADLSHCEQQEQQEQQEQEHHPKDCSSIDMDGDVAVISGIAAVDVDHSPASSLASNDDEQLQLECILPACAEQTGSSLSSVDVDHIIAEEQQQEESTHELASASASTVEIKIEMELAVPKSMDQSMNQLPLERVAVTAVSPTTTSESGQETTNDEVSGPSGISETLQLKISGAAMRVEAEIAAAVRAVEEMCEDASGSEAEDCSSDADCEDASSTSASSSSGASSSSSSSNSTMPIHDCSGTTPGGGPRRPAPSPVTLNDTVTPVDVYVSLDPYRSFDRNLSPALCRDVAQLMLGLSETTNSDSGGTGGSDVTGQVSLTDLVAASSHHHTLSQLLLSSQASGGPEYARYCCLFEGVAVSPNISTESLAGAASTKRFVCVVPRAPVDLSSMSMAPQLSSPSANITTTSNTVTLGHFSSALEAALVREVFLKQQERTRASCQQLLQQTLGLGAVMNSGDSNILGVLGGLGGLGALPSPAMQCSDRSVGRRNFSEEEWATLLAVSDLVAEFQRGRNQ